MLNMANKKAKPNRNTKRKPASAKATASQPAKKTALKAPLAPASKSVLKSGLKGVVKKVLAESAPAAPAAKPVADTALASNIGAAAGAFDTALGGTLSKGKKSAITPSKQTPTAAPAEPELLLLPDGGLVALRKSGGLLFSSREIVVYEDGRATVRNDSAVGRGLSLERKKLSKIQLNKVQRLLNEANFGEVPTNAKQNPDAFAYELTTRKAGMVVSVELFDGSMPKSFRPLVDTLVQLMV